MIIGIFGLSGVGKTTLVKKYISINNDVVGFSASAMIKNHGGVVNYDSLTENTVQENQKILLNSINNYEKTEDRPLIIELHNIIETPIGIVSIDDIFDSLKIDAACFIFKDPKIILKNRMNDSEKLRINASLIDVDTYQKISLDLFNQKFLNIKKMVISSAYKKNFKRFLDDVLS